MYDLLSDEPTFPFYQHIRRFNKDGSYNPRGGKTICYLKDADRQLIGVGVAKCSKSDNYCKATGRELSLDRINQLLTSKKLEARNRRDQALVQSAVDRATAHYESLVLENANV